MYVASKVAAALDYAHRRRDTEGHELTIVHRDVSPQNILISYEGDIKLCDFGIAKAASKASQTQSGALKGKVQYMSPEQAWGKALDRRSDLFSLGAVLFEMLTEQKLFRGDSDLTVLEKVRAADVVGPSSINPEISKASEDTELLDEGCLSVPGFWGQVVRANKVSVKALDRNGKEQRIRDAEGLFAQALQHEIDHLDGKLYIDRMDSTERLQRSEPIRKPEAERLRAAKEEAAEPA